MPKFLSKEEFSVVKERLAETRGAALSNFLHPAVFREIIIQAFAGPMNDGGVVLVETLRCYVQARDLIPLLWLWLSLRWRRSCNFLVLLCLLLCIFLRRRRPSHSSKRSAPPALIPFISIDDC